MPSLVSFLPLLGGLAAAQQFVPAPQNLELVTSELFEGAEISYKKTSICETTEGVNAYSGYVKLPKELLPDATAWEEGSAAHLFFWYFEARNNAENAPTSIYVGGGPGASTIDGVSDFPCFFNADSNSTTLNEWSWNNNVNMLYIDQPVQTGYSYVSLQNGTMNLLTQEFAAIDSDDDLPELTPGLRQATLDPRLPETIPNNTMAAARTLWVFSQVWLNEFPEWQTENDQLSLWTQSYGGFFGPGIFEYFQEQNQLINNGEEAALPHATVINLATLGLNDACIDTRAMSLGYPTFAYNNTYGLQIYSEEVYDMVVSNITEPETGCYALIDRCRALADEGDPHSFGNNQTVNEACVAASNLCFNEVQGAYQVFSDRSAFDVTHSNTTGFPPAYRDIYLNQAWVQAELGVPLNWTTSPTTTTQAYFFRSGDPMRRTLHSVEKLLAGGVNVALVYGDRDYRCPWYGGENVSLTLEFESAESFRAAGYAPITTNSSYQGGFVRQHGALSFSRIFQAGHGVGGYQPETMSKLFERTMFGYDVATGEVALAANADYASEGPATVYDVTNEVPELEENVCFLAEAPLTCTQEQLEALISGNALIEDWIVVDPKGVTPVPIHSTNGPSDGESSPPGSDQEGEDGGSDNNGGTNAGVKTLAGWSGIASAVTVVAMLI